MSNDPTAHSSNPPPDKHPPRSTARLHGGHIVAVSLGRFASGPNLFPQEHRFNISAYARLEHGWRRALIDAMTVEVDIALTLDADPFVPQFIVTYWENGEEPQLGSVKTRGSVTSCLDTTYRSEHCNPARTAHT